MQICESKNCTGCFACMNACPQDAISVVLDLYGQTVPYIDAEKCISCGLCQKICPMNHEPALQLAERAIAAWSKNDQDVSLSSSGGAAAVISRTILQQGGVVFGASCYNAKTRHICIQSVDSIDLLRGSKYVQSEIGQVYREAKAKLQAQQPVLFIGTPCQVAGLKSYLHKDYEKLVTVDLICHGTPPHKYLEQHLNHLVGEKKWDSYSFRGKLNYHLVVYHKHQIIYQQQQWQDEFFSAFSDKLIFRDSCYSCRFARPERVSDITVGDFWGIERSTLKHPYTGRISLVLPNTEKGGFFFEQCKDALIWEERSLKEAMNEAQGSLLHPSVPHKERDIFLQLYPSIGFERAIQKTQLGKQVVRNRRKAALRNTIPVKILRKVKRAFVQQVTAKC